MTAPSLADAAARRRAATDFDTNLVVEAGAGTGKTSLLVERVLNAIGLGRAEIDRIAAITFTEKAAGEMRQRVADGLERMRGLARGEHEVDPSDEAGRAFAYLRDEAGIERPELESRALAALERLDRATITTIHAFCADLLRRDPREAGVDPDFVVDRGEQTELLVDELWERFLERALGPGADRPDLWRELLDSFDPSSIGELARALVNPTFTEATLRRDDPCVAASGSLEAIGAELLEELELALPDGVRMPSTKGDEYFAAVRRALRGLAGAGWPAARELFERDEALAGRNDGYAPSSGKGFEVAAVVELSRRFWKLRRSLLAADDRILSCAVRAVTPFVIEAREAVARQGWIGFDGLLEGARRLLLQAPAVRRRVKRRFRMVLVDEFQDTDPLQYDIVLLLAEREGDDADDPYAAALEPGRLFIVGDPKQSIYRFRGADYAAYAEAVARVLSQGGVRLDLVSNFRSVAGIVDPVNRLFRGERSAWRPSVRQPDYVPIEAVRRSDDSGARVELWSQASDGKIVADTRRIGEARIIADAIARNVADGRCAYRDATILFRSFGSVAIYLRALRDRRIPFVIDGGKEFLQRPEVTWFIATLRSIAEPSDGPALLAFLRSPAGGATDRELVDYGRSGGAWDWRAEVDGERFPRLAAGFDLLRRLAAEGRRRPADGWIREVLRQTGSLPLAAAGFEGSQRVANLLKVAAAAGRLARSGRLSLTEVVEAIAAGRLAELDGESPLADDRADAVRITSIHRMKGLESEWIILPDVARLAPGESRSAAAVLTQGARDSRSLAVTLEGIHSTAWIARSEDDRLHDRAEEARVLYVAASRARERLILLTDDGDRDAPWKQALLPWGYRPGMAPDPAGLADGLVRLVAVDDPGPRQRAGLEPAPVPREWSRHHRAAAERLRVVAAGPGAPSELEADAPHDADLPPVSQAGGRDTARAVGVVLHRALEDWSGEPDSLRRSIEIHASAAAAEHGLQPAAVLAEARALTDSFLASELVARFAGLTILGRELPMLHRTGGRRWRGSLDLLARDRRGAVVLVDYKTDREPTAEGLARRYGPTLRVYAEAVRHSLGLSREPTVEIWALRTGEVFVFDGADLQRSAAGPDRSG